MDRNKIDDLSKMVASWSPRRRILGSLAAALVAPLLPRSTNVAGAACKEVGKNCDKSNDCCDHAKCKHGKCRCKDGYKNCDGKCKNLDKDEQHCGACNATCPENQHCCDGDCVDRRSNRGHCGACGNACAAAEECFDGACINLAGTCAAGAAYCFDSTLSCSGSPDCRCAESTEGDTICGYLPTPGNSCGECDTSADCASYGPGAFCMRTGGDSACCGPDAQNACLLPCPTLFENSAP